jgi:DNA-binding transcriptional MerR regulator
MARVRHHKRKRRGYVRPSRAKAKAGWSLRDLSTLTGFSSRNIRAYLQRGIVPRAAFHASATRYDRRQLVWLLALRRLRENERLPLTRIRSRLESLSPAELEAIATEGLAPGAVANALGVAPPVPAPALSSPAGLPSPVDTPRTLLPRWTRIELALGLELHVRDDASASTLELVHRIQSLRP